MQPAPVLRVVHQLRADGIEQDIAENREEMRVVLNGKTLEAALPDMAMTPVVPMITPHMTGHPPLHERAESGRDSWLHDEMKMIGHQAKAKNLDGISGFCRAAQIKEGGIVGVLVKDGCAAVATVQDVVGVSGAVSARNPRHGRRRLRQLEAGEQGKVACPLSSPPRVINGRTSLSPEMAVRVSKAFGSTVEHWMRMQLAYDLAAVEKTAKSIKVKRFPEVEQLAV